jgi:hypothetical protein
MRNLGLEDEWGELGRKWMCEEEDGQQEPEVRGVTATKKADEGSTCRGSRQGGRFERRVSSAYARCVGRAGGVREALIEARSS